MIRPPSPSCDRVLHDDFGAPYGLTVNRQTYASHQKYIPYAHRQGMSHNMSLTVSSLNGGPRLYVAPKVKGISCEEVAPPRYQVAMAYPLNVQQPSRMIPPRFQKIEQHRANVAPLTGQPDRSLDYSPFPKQLVNPASGRRPQTTYNKEPICRSSSPLSAHDNACSLAPALDIKSALRAQGIQVGIQAPSNTPDPHPHPHIDKTALPLPSLPPAAPMCDYPDLSGQKDSTKPLQCNLDVRMRAPHRPTIPEQSERLAGSQSPVNQGGKPNLVGPVHVNLPPPSKAKETIRNVQSSMPRVSLEDLDPLTIKPGSPEPLIALNNVKLPPAQGRSQSLEPSLKQSLAPEPLDTTVVGISLSASGKNEMCRKWYIGVCHNPQCHFAHKVIPSNLTCSLWFRGKCTRSQCPFMHKRQKPNGPAKNRPSSTPGDTQVMDQDSIRPSPSSGTGSSAVQKPEIHSHSTGGPSPVAPANAPENNAPDKARATSSVISSSPSSSSVPKVQKHRVESHGPRRPSDNASDQVSCTHSEKPNSSQPKQICFDWLRNRCMRTPCRFLHERLPNDNTPEMNSPSSCSSSPSQKSHSAQNTVSCDSLSSLKSPPRNPSPPIRRNDDFGIPVIIADHTIVKLRDGFAVQDVATGFESRWVHIGGLPPHLKEEKIRLLLEEFGQLDTLVVPSGTDRKSAKLTIRAQYSTAAQATRASVELQGRYFQGKKLTAKLPLNTSERRTTMLDDTTVRINWTAPQRLGYAGYATLDEAKAVIATATGFVMKDNVLTADLYEGLPAVGAYNVMFRHLPADAERKDLEQFGHAESIMFERPNYQSLDSARKAVLQLLRSCGNMSSFDLPLPIRNGLVSAWATFESHADASSARDHLDTQYPRAMGGKVYVSARHVQSLRFVLPLVKYKMLEEDIPPLRQSWRTRFDHDVTLVDRLMSPDGPVTIKISAGNLSNLGVAKAEFEKLQHGEVVTLEKKPIWDSFFSQPSGQSFLRELEGQYPGVGIQTRMGKILLLGRIAQRQLARQAIMTRFQELRAQRRWYIPLSGKVVGALVSKDLLTLQESVGPDNCQILLSNQHTLLIRGNEQTYRIACEVVEKVQSRHAHSPGSSLQSICPVCFSEASVPTRLSCGHSWCTSCLQRYLMSALENKAFPLTCLGNDASCTERISLVLAKRILSGDEFTALCEASFWLYIHARTEEFHHCPTPDCAQVYRAAPAGTILQCPSCLVRICPACHTEVHDGLTCEERGNAEDKLFHEWAATHDVKNCPGCKTPIERSEGCNHMTCIRCQTHICWQCLATFPKGDGIYQHMRHEHGGIGL